MVQKSHIDVYVCLHICAHMCVHVCVCRHVCVYSKMSPTSVPHMLGFVPPMAPPLLITCLHPSGIPFFRFKPIPIYILIFPPFYLKANILLSNSSAMSGAGQWKCLTGESRKCQQLLRT